MIVSFVIPAYNASTTIIRCLSSIYSLGLSEQEFEVICIDDCSSDNTISLIEEYAKSHDNLILIRQTENHRQGAARNRGVAIAKGKYIVFVDSDDESDRGVIPALQLADEYELDMVAMHYVNIDEYGKRFEKERIRINGVFTGVELQTEQPYWCAGPVPYIYNSEFLQKVNYPFTEDVLFEDSDFVNVHIYHAKRIMYMPTVSYRVHYNSQSTTHTISYKHVADYFMLGVRMLKFYDSLVEKSSIYANEILEGGSWNIQKACLMLFKLNSYQDLQFFYKRIDTNINRVYFFQNKTFIMSWWTKMCIYHKNSAIRIAFLLQYVYRFIIYFRNKK